VKKVLSWGALIVVCLWAYHNPNAAADFVRRVVDVLSSLAASL
jgi:hypothetical protein